MERNRYSPKVRIAAEGLEARLLFPTPEAGTEPEKYTRDMLRRILMEANVTFGIDMGILDDLCAHPVYDREVVVATGITPIPGTPGYYEYHFDTDLSKKPIIRQDGTTDYMNIKSIEIVNEGDVIATYHPAVQGSSGMNVRGIEMFAKPERELPAIMGRGFNKSRDGLTYTAAISGKIDLLDNNKIMISPLYEVKGDASIETGNIDFNGDVIIHGGACDGVKIKARGNITIEGLVETCQIEAGKDLFLLSGVKGGEVAKISAGGNITAEFIEYANVECSGDIIGDVIFKSRVMCDGKITLNGKKSSIIGGYTTAIRGIDVNNVGNDFGTITNVAVGIDAGRISAVESLKNTIRSLSDNVEKISAGISEFERMGKENGFDYKEDPRRTQLMKIKIRDEGVIAESKAKLERLEAVIIGAKDATLRVFDTVYAGANVSIDSHKVSLTDYQKHVEFVKTEDGVRLDKLEGVIL